MYRDEVIAVAIVLFCVACIITSAIVIPPMKCEKKFNSYGATRFSFMEGCMVYHKGRWIPSETIREI